MPIKVQAPASKSHSHRALIGAALAVGESVVHNVLESVDLTRTRSVLEGAGATITRLEAGKYAVTGMAGVPRGAGLGGESVVAKLEDMGNPEGVENKAPDTVAPLSCDMHESGTSCRLLTAIMAAGRGHFCIHGAPRLHDRPIGELVDVLRELGVEIHYMDKEGYPPLHINTFGMDGGDVVLGMDMSSQFLSGLLLAAPMMHAPLRVTVGGKVAVSWPYVGLTLQALEDYGVPFTVETRDPKFSENESPWRITDWRTITEAVPFGTRFSLEPAPFMAGNHTVEGDWSGASYLLAAGALGAKPVEVCGLRANSIQGDRSMLDILEAMGAQISINNEAQSITVYPSKLRGITVDMGHCPDLVPTVAVLAAFAEGPTTIYNAAHLRIKECDRIAAPIAELAKIGVIAEAHDDGMTIQGGTSITPNTSVHFSSYGDHRIAMSLALLSLHSVIVDLDDAACVSKSFPAFWDVWKVIADGQGGE